MKDADCVTFLQQTLPYLHLRWPGFRKVRAQVCKRIARRIQELDLSGLAAYRNHLRIQPAEWRVLDALCRVSISRFYRDKQVFRLLEQEYLPALADQAMAQSGGRLRIWSVGCAAGEEPYTLSLLWHFALAARYPSLCLQVLATDVDTTQLLRAREACYGYSSIKNLPENWRQEAFLQVRDKFCLQRDFLKPVEFRQHDVRDVIPDSDFHLVLCRNLVFTYFDAGLQQAFLDKLQRSMMSGGVLMLGVHERLPEIGHRFTTCSARWGLYRWEGSKLNRTDGNCPLAVRE